MILTYEDIWEPCSKEEFDKGCEEYIEGALRFSDTLIPYRRVPIYHNARPGLLWQMENFGKEPDEWRYEKWVGREPLILINSAEANDKQLMKLLKQCDHE